MRLGRREVRPAHGHEAAAHELEDQEGEPVGVGHAVRVGVGDDLAGRRLGAHVARDAEPLVLLADDDHARAAGVRVVHRLVPLADLERAVLRAVVDDDHLVVGVVERAQRLEAGVHGALGVVGADHDRDTRRSLEARRQRGRVLRLDRAVGGLRLPVGIHQTEGPVGDLRAAGEPVVGPGEDEGAGHARLEAGADHPGEQLGLPVGALAQRVDAELGQHERLVLGDVLEPREVAAEVDLAVEVDVEGDEVDEVGHVEVLGGRKVGVAHQRGGRALLHLVAQRAQEVAHAIGSVPAHDVGRHLVADEEAEERGMVAAGLARGAHGAADLRHQGLVVEEADVLRPRDGDQHAQPVLGGAVEEPARRHGEGAEAVHAELRHEPEVGLQRRLVGKGKAVPGDPERPVGDAAQVELVVAHEEELAPDGGRRVVERRSGGALRQRAQHGLRHKGRGDRPR